MSTTKLLNKSKEKYIHAVTIIKIMIEFTRPNVDIIQGNVKHPAPIVDEQIFNIPLNILFPFTPQYVIFD